MLSDSESPWSDRASRTIQVFSDCIKRQFFNQIQESSFFHCLRQIIYGCYNTLCYFLIYEKFLRKIITNRGLFQGNQSDFAVGWLYGNQRKCRKMANMDGFVDISVVKIYCLETSMEAFFSQVIHAYQSYIVELSEFGNRAEGMWKREKPIKQTATDCT